MKPNKEQAEKVYIFTFLPQFCSVLSFFRTKEHTFVEYRAKFREIKKVRKIIIERSQKNIFLFEQSKLHKKYFYTLCHKDDVDSIITM